MREAVAEARVAPSAVAGLGFDATCSLVALDADGGSLPVGPNGDPERDTIVWMDHRAVAEADEINAGGHGVLRYVGGAISPEMQPRNCSGSPAAPLGPSPPPRISSI